MRSDLLPALAIVALIAGAVTLGSLMCLWLP